MIADNLHFLTALARNNNREWFDQNREWYETSRKALESLTDELITGICTFDPTLGTPKAKECTFRIFRDTRFTNDKTPYKINMGTYMARGGRKSVYAGYYLHLEPDGKSFASGGLYMPPPENLKKVRQEIFYHIDEFKKILQAKTFVTHFKELDAMGDELKKAPLGYDPAWADIDLLKKKHYVAGKSLEDKDFSSPKLTEKVLGIFKLLYPLNSFINRALEIPIK